MVAKFNSYRQAGCKRMSTNAKNRRKPATKPVKLPAVTLSPLSFDDAISGLLAVKPPEKKTKKPCPKK
jgi:hypothetical protein